MPGFTHLRRPLKRIAALAAVIVVGVTAGAAQTMPDGRPTPTGLDVPRWISLKSSQVRARRGPGLDHAVLWEYRVAGLPVQVIAETREWRKICDAEGSVAWIHRSVASGRRQAYNVSDREAPVLASRATDAAVRARIAPRSLVPLENCENGWCRVRADKRRGWVPQGSLFGTQAQALCDANRPAGRATDRPRPR